MRILDQVHIDFLTSQETLKLWAGYTLQERTMLFRERFPGKEIAITSLRKLYNKNRIKRKVVREAKLAPEKTKINFPA